jgi:hypothetical protein
MEKMSANECNKLALKKQFIAKGTLGTGSDDHKTEKLKIIKRDKCKV